MRRERWDRVAAASRRGEPRLDNLALVPASLLPHKVTYQRLANQLPAGAVLVVLPTEDSPERQTLQEAAARLRWGRAPSLYLGVTVLTVRRRRPRPPLVR